MALIATLARCESSSLQAASVPSSGENRTGRISLVVTPPSLGFSTRISVCASGRPAGIDGGSDRANEDRGSPAVRVQGQRPNRFIISVQGLGTIPCCARGGKPDRCMGPRRHLSESSSFGWHYGFVLYRLSRLAICSTRSTMRRRNFESSILMNALVKARPSAVARKSET